MASLLCLLFGSLNAKHNPFPSTMGLFILSNKTFRVLFLIDATSSSAIGRLILLSISPLQALYFGMYQAYPVDNAARLISGFDFQI